MKNNSFSAIVLAGGQSRRMKSKTSKVLHKIGSKTLISTIIEILNKLSPAEIIIVGNTNNFENLKKIITNADFALQKKPLGTLDATKVGLKKIKSQNNTIAILYGDDTAFYKEETLLQVFQKHTQENNTITFVSLIKQNPANLGRIIRKNGKVSKIVEEKDASSDEKSTKEVNDGVYFFDKNWLINNVNRIKPSKTTGEYYLTDLISHAISCGKKVEAFTLTDESQWHGINDKAQLNYANWKLRKKLHFMGISGAGAAATAAIASKNGFTVSGCDLNTHSSYSQSLSNIKVTYGHSTEHLKGQDALIISPAVSIFNQNNREITSASKQKIITVSWQQFQADVLQHDKYTIAAAGAYGKSTTAAIIAQILIDQNLDPTCEIGAKVLAWGKNYRVGKSAYYVFEADEYNDNFLFYKTDIAVILNLRWDHPDYFKTEEKLIKSYIAFANNIKKNGYLIVGNDSNFQKLIPHLRRDIKVIKINNSYRFNLSIIGDFRQENAQAAYEVAKLLTLDLKKAQVSINKFTGLARRLEFKGKCKNFDLWDDYAVQPHTIKSTTNALLAAAPNKPLILVLEPHTQSRISVFFDKFTEAISKTNANEILITDIFSARESGDTSSLSKKLAESTGKRVRYIPTLSEAADYIKMKYQKATILSMGAGNSYQFADIFKKNNG